MPDRPTLKLGHVDKGSMLSDSQLSKYFQNLHHIMSPALQALNQFRDDGRWHPLTELSENGTPVRDLQDFLHEHGFLPYNYGPNEKLPRGIFDYITLSGVRLFQEYVRTLDKESDPKSIPDGMVGQGTWAHVDRWKEDKLMCEWATGEPSIEFLRWFRLMEAAKSAQLENPHLVIQELAKKKNTGDTLPPDKWKFDPKEVQFIGIRRNQEEKATEKRTNDDVFLLLINGMVFKFWGSTDPSAQYTGKNRDPFLIEGQHMYKFGWHFFSNAKKAYKALKPATTGVMVFRDNDQDHAFTTEDISGGLTGPNDSINIHWSGIGSTNYSGGCQVISALSYLNNRNKVINCAPFTSTNDGALKPGKTRGAYNFLVDLVLAYTKSGTTGIRYTLGRDDILNLEAGIGAGYATQVFDVLRNPANATA